MRRLFDTVFDFGKKIKYWQNIRVYKRRGSKPWGRGYFEYKWQHIRKAINDNNLIEAFRDKKTLPPQFGIRIDERMVEYPWVIAHMPQGQDRLLDAGSALNFIAILSHPAFLEKKITIVTLHPETNSFSDRGISYLYGDIRTLSFPPDSFDIITCISTLEHVGMDNTQIYTSDPRYKENKREDYLVALAELKRVLKPKGKLLLTVPYGQYGNFGFFQQFDRAMIERVKGLFSSCDASFYKYDQRGWQVSTEEECKTAEYVIAERAKKDSSLAAAASAVACLELIK